MRVRAGVVGALAVLALGGCGPDGDEGSGRAAPDLTPDLTPRGIAAVVGDHVAQEPRADGAWDVMTRELGVEAPGATVRLGDGDSLDVAVAPTTDSALVCADRSFFDACVDLGDDGDGGRVVLGWQEQVPEEDPGVVYVIDRRDGEDVIARYIGASIEGDPREQDLGVTVEQMSDVVTDDRLTLG